MLAVWILQCTNIKHILVSHNMLEKIIVVQDVSVSASAHAQYVF